MGRHDANWITDSLVEIGEERVLITDDSEVYRAVSSTDDQFLLIKDADYVRRSTRSFCDLGIRNLVEAGIWQGGSVVYWNLALGPSNHLAFDLYDRSVPALERFAQRSDVRDGLSVEYGLDQADAAALTAATTRRFGPEPIDLIIDDASHLYEPSRIMFETLFPRLRPGGWYVIEDWQWSHSHTLLTNESSSYFAGRRGLSNLVLEAVILSGSRLRPFVERVIIDSFCAIVVRGDHDGRFKLDEQVFSQGRPFEPVL
ncbi:class I SAM-dependent methyltransferase [Desertimonas flava]|uniref:class I SAM-dependent methyltransferase n=1 Tax=Desertimonas flava TaxID=2064846 RepID=UPI0013C4E020|nr:class I SAM-dependent methyltransferase [Desertimonas flava]